MSKIMEGKTAIVLGVWNKWSIAYAIAHAFVREGANLLLTYQNDRAKPQVEDLGRELGAKGYFPCDVQKQGDIIISPKPSRRPDTSCTSSSTASPSRITRT